MYIKNIYIKRQSIVNCVVCSILYFVIFNSAWAGDPIGKFTSVVQKEEDPISIYGADGKRAACVGCLLYEGDRIETKKKQMASFELEDGSVVDLGSHAILVLENWSNKDSDGVLKRSLSLVRGALRTVVNKVYSQKEPFLIKSKNAIMGVRGTEFIASINSERLSGREKAATTTLFTITGEVHFAKSESDFAAGNAVVARAGYRSVIAQGMDVPTTPVKFKQSSLNKVLKDRIPQVKSVQIQKTEKYDVLDARATSVMRPPNTAESQKRRGSEGSVGAEGVRPPRRNAAVPGRSKPNIPQPNREKRKEQRAETIRSLKPQGPAQEALASESKAKNFNKLRQSPAEGGEYQAPPVAGGVRSEAVKPPLAGSGFQRMMPGAPGSTSRPPGQAPGARSTIQPRPRPGEQQLLRRRPPPPQLPPPPAPSGS